MVFVVTAAAAVSAVVLAGLYWAARQAPPFYLQALAAERDTQQAAGDQLERRSFALHNALRHPGRWSAQFTQDEINGWLATEVPSKFPTILPPGISQPRVAIGKDRVQLAARYERRGVQTILSLASDIQLTTTVNEIAVRIERARAGSLPMPLGKLLEEVSALAASVGIPLRWTEIDGDPVALLKLPVELNDRRIAVDAIKLAEGAVVIAGHTEPDPPRADSESTRQAERSGEHHQR